MIRVLPLALLFASAALPAQAPPADADALAEQVRRLGSNPQDLDALLTAGELSIRLEDLSAAGAFFARAEKLDPRNGRAKAGEAAILVHSERPAEAMRYFAQAEQLGLAPARFAGERGLAYDLLGDPGRAHRDYQAALAAADTAEVRRRYALSLAIAGRQEQALAALDPLIRQNDRAAWRSRAFVLAMGGDAAGATRIAETMMPPGAATALQTFFAELPRLAPVDKAFAVHFGEVQATPQRLADARLPHEAPLPLAPVAVAQTPVVVTTPVADDRRSRRDRKRRGEVQVAAVAPPPPPPPPLPAPPAYQAPTYVVPSASTPVRDDRPLTAGERAALAAGGNRARPPLMRATPVAAPVRALSAEEQRSLAAAAGSRDGTTSHRPDPVRTPPPVVVVASRPVEPASSPPRVIASVTPVRAPVVTSQVARVPVVQTPPSRVVNPPRPAPPTPGFSAASGVEVASTGTAPRASTTPAVSPRPPRSRRADYAHADSVLSRIVANLSVPAAELEVGTAAPTAAQRRAAERRAAADKKAVADRKAAAAAKAEADRAAAEERRVARSNPPRIWVQVAGGANEAGLPLAWRTMQGRAGTVLNGRQAWTTPLRATNRVLTGPFKTEAEARTVVNQLGRAGVQAFTFTSDAGQKVTRLTP